MLMLCIFWFKVTILLLKNDDKGMTNYNYKESMKGYEESKESLTLFKNN